MFIIIAFAFIAIMFYVHFKEDNKEFYSNGDILKILLFFIFIAIMVAAIIPTT